jgi:hypothetical protein
MLSGSQIVYVNVTWCFSSDIVYLSICLCKCYMVFYLRCLSRFSNCLCKCYMVFLVVMLSSYQFVYLNVAWCLVVMLYTYHFVVYVNVNVTWCFSCDIIKLSICLYKCYIVFYLVVMLSSSQIVYVNVTVT